MWSENSRLFPSLRRLLSAWTMFTLPVRWLVSCLILACFYYAILTPLALLFRLLGRDVLGLCWDPALQSYWKARPAPPDLRSYFRAC
jgi:hypothetical protein